MSVTLHTNFGDLKLELHCELCPKTCENFLALCASKYYDGVLFHRNVKGFIIQGGDPTGTGKGGDSIWGGAFEDEINADLKHDERGVVSMANTGANKNKSQFFITYAKHPHLDGRYTVFGRVIWGHEVLRAMENVPVSDKHVPTREIKIERVTIHANPIAEAAAS